MHHIHYSPLKWYMLHIYNRGVPVPIYIEDRVTVVLDAEFGMRSFLKNINVVIASRIGHASHTLLTPKLWYAPHQCSDLSLQKERQATLHSLTRYDWAVTNVDAANCFDRIPPSIMYIAYCKAGLHSKPILLLSKALLSHKYIPITEHGESINIDNHSTEHPFFDQYKYHQMGQMRGDFYMKR